VVSATDRQASAKAESATAASGILTFYLDMQSDVEAAPTIGPKTAELLYEIGIHTVGHLLESTPAEVAEQLHHPRISANNVLEWQLQSALVCRVPELRGHDAQILVACGVTEAEQLAAYDPQDLYDIVKPFVRSKAGKRIVRTSKAPDLAEVSDWIRFAKHARQLKAA
jgi:predicted flap endonuclease-1-like 5' DNA nuclease